jgi:hypothetical protein
MINRRKLLGTGIAASIVMSAPAVLAAPTITLNPSPSGDDAPQINAALATIRGASRGMLILDQQTTTPFNIKSPINGTGLQFAEILFTPGSDMRCDGFASNGPMIDISNSGFTDVSCQSNLGSILFGLDANSPSGTMKPCCAVLVSGGDSKAVRNMATAGSFGAGAICLVNSGSFTMIGGGYGNADNTAPTLMLSGNPDWGVNSPFTTMTNGGSCQELHIEHVEIHQFGLAPWVLYLRTVNNAHFSSMLLSGGRANRAIAQGSNNNLTFEGGTASYDTSPDTAASVMTCGSPDNCQNLRFFGFSPQGLPYTRGSGNFAGFAAY